MAADRRAAEALYRMSCRLMSLLGGRLRGQLDRVARGTIGFYFVALSRVAIETIIRSSAR